MPVPSQRYVRNHLLSILSPDDYEAIQSVAEGVALGRRDILIAANKSITHV